MLNLCDRFFNHHTFIRIFCDVMIFHLPPSAPLVIMKHVCRVWRVDVLCVCDVKGIRNFLVIFIYMKELTEILRCMQENKCPPFCFCHQCLVNGLYLLIKNNKNMSFLSFERILLWYFCFIVDWCSQPQGK